MPYLPTNRRRVTLASTGISLLLAFLLILVVVQTMTASSLAAVLNASLNVDRTQAAPGQVLEYRVAISNTGSTADNLIMTDTLPISLTFQVGSLVSTTNQAFATGYAANGGVITWTGSVGAGGSADIVFRAAITDTVKAGDLLVNKLELSGSGGYISLTAVTTIISQTETFLPIMFRPLPKPTIQPIGRPDSSNSWTVQWDNPAPSVITGFELQESNNIGFAGASAQVMGVVTQSVRNPAPSFLNSYYYRVRALGPTGPGPWSNIAQVIGAYFDQFDDPSSGWTMRRQDTDTVANQTYYRNGWFVMEMDSGYDYQIAAPMVAAPTPPYRIETQARLVGQDNLHSYGLIFGGDWNGHACPASDYSSCFNHYYRLIVIWSGASNTLKVQLKRIDYHDASNNAGRGVQLFAHDGILVNAPSEGPQIWSVEVYPNGQIKLFANGTLFATVYDSTYINDPYFGTFSSVDEYTGIEAEFNWYKVDLLP